MDIFKKYVSYNKVKNIPMIQFTRKWIFSKMYLPYTRAKWTSLRENVPILHKSVEPKNRESKKKRNKGHGSNWGNLFGIGDYVPDPTPKTKTRSLQPLL
jgi:hypothetical protein